MNKPGQSGTESFASIRGEQFDAGLMHQASEARRIEYARVLCTGNSPETVDQQIVRNDRGVPSEPPIQNGRDDVGRVLHRTRSVLSVPSSDELSIVQFMSVDVYSVAEFQVRRQVAPHHAIVRKRKPNSPVPVSSSLMRFEDLIDSQDRRQASVCLRRAVSVLSSQIADLVSGLKSRCEPTSAAQAADPGAFMQQIGFATNRAVDEWRRTGRAADRTTSYVGDQRNVRVQKIPRHVGIPIGEVSDDRVRRFSPRASIKQVPLELLEQDLASGAPHAADGTISLVHYAAWLVKEMGRVD